MKQRIITALWGIPLLLAFIWFDTSWFPLIIFLVAAFAAIGALEFYRLAALSGGQPLTLFGIVWTLLFIASAHLDATYEVSYLAPSLLGSAIVLPLVWLFFVPPKGRALVSWAWTLAGILYMGWMLGHYVALRELDQGKGWVIFALFSTFACDTAAFFIGRTWGRRPLAPTISPGKTWEGAVGGFMAALAAALILYTLLDVTGLSLPISYAQTILLGCLIGLFAQLGDLLESLLKRRAGVKDSGSLIPGHGGILDRIDSLVFIGVIVYYYVIWVVD
jgi:phosphatidate cytidylyltransferase